MPVTSGDPAAVSAGTMLRNARESIGMSIDTVSQQLKLAPRQVQALEADDFAQLPGRTFVRGFMRNYARLLHLDANAVLATLPESGTAPSLDRPSLSSTTRAMGEMPAEQTSKPSNARWAIPLAIAAIVAIALAYEFGRPLAERGRAALAGRVMSTPAPSPASAQEATPIAPPPIVSEAAVAAKDAAPPQLESATTVAVAAPSGETPIVFVFRGTSWIEVKDAKGVIVLSTMGYPGATHAVGGALPLEVVLGNAEAVNVTLRGAPFDTTPYQKQNVAKFQVK